MKSTDRTKPHSLSLKWLHFSWFWQNAKTCWDALDKMPTKNWDWQNANHNKKCVVGILSGWHFAHTPNKWSMCFMLTSDYTLKQRNVNGFHKDARGRWCQVLLTPQYVPSTTQTTWWESSGTVDVLYTVSPPRWIEVECRLKENILFVLYRGEVNHFL